MPKISINERNEKIFSNCRKQKTYLIVNKQVKFLTAFPSSQINIAKLAFAMSWRGYQTQYIGTYKSAYTKGYALN